MEKITPYQSIITFIEDTQEDLYYLFERLGVLDALVPKKNVGRTFLMPDRALRQKIREHAYKNQEEDALEIAKSLILIGCIDSLRDFQDAAQIMDFRKKKLPAVDKISGKDGCIILTNGAKIRPNKTFRAAAKSGIMVFDLEGSLHENQEAADMKVAAAPRGRAVRRGADLKQALFAKYGRSHQLAKKCLLGLINHLIAEQNLREDDRIAQKIQTVIELCSSDAIISLYIVLQPFRNAQKHTYLDDGDIQNINESLFAKYRVSTYDNIAAGSEEDISNIYKPFMTRNNENIKVIARADRDMSHAQPPSICNLMFAFIREHSDKVSPLRRFIYSKDANADESLAIAEAELRLFSYISHDNETIAGFLNSLERKFKLDAPCYCRKQLITKQDRAVFTSIPYTMIRSNVLLFICGDQADYTADNKTNSNLCNEDARILIDVSEFI